jgi:hypothetical protein
MTDEADARIAALADAYRRVFGAPGQRSADQMLVWADLVRFCRPYRPTFDPDDRVTCLREGRREVFLRIADPLTLAEPSVEEIFAQMGLTRKDTPDD